MPKHIAHAQGLTALDVQRMKGALSIIKLHEGFGVPLFREEKPELTTPEQRRAKRHRYTGESPRKESLGGRTRMSAERLIEIALDLELEASFMSREGNCLRRCAAALRRLAELTKR